MNRWPVFVTKAVAWVFLALALAGLYGCEKKKAEEQAPVTQPATVADDTLEAATLAAWQQANLDLSRTQESTAKLCGTIAPMLTTPSDSTLAAVRASWHNAHNDYRRLGLFLALAESNPGLFGQLQEINSLLDAWPIQPGYLDYFDVYTHSGIVNDIAVPITADAVRRQHGFSDATDVSLGFHAIAYLLWGERGARPATDFVAASRPDAAQQAAGLSVVDLPSNRRRTLLTLMCTLVIDDLTWLSRVWNQSSGDLPQGYLALSPHSRLQLLKTAVLQYVNGNLLAAEIEPLFNNDASEVNTDSGEANDNTEEALHNRFAGGGAASMAAGLKGVERLLLGPETRLADWLLEESERALLQQHLARVQELLAADPAPWTERGENLRALRSALKEVANLLGNEPSAEGVFIDH